jgi:hypothetical protein
MWQVLEGFESRQGLDWWKGERMHRTKNILRLWLPLVAVISGLSALAFMAVQQTLRQGANDPQIQLAEDAAAALDAGQKPEAVLPPSQVDLANSLAPFVTVYDRSGKAVVSSGLLDGQMPDYPVGALQAAKSSGENRVTWQPRPNVRIASVVVPYKDGYLVAGRSLREVEEREGQAQTIVFTLWIATLLAALAAVVFGEYALRS